MKKLFLIGFLAIQHTSMMFAMEQPLQHEQKDTRSKKYNLFFLGESCAGKTTLMQQLCILSNEFYIPKLTLTRPQRLDDDPKLFDFVSVEEYLKSRNFGEFIFDMDDGKTYYGYKMKHVNIHDKHALLYSSPYFIEQSKNIENSLLILVEADKEKGFIVRQDPSEIKEKRRQLNKQLSSDFFNKDFFKQKMDLIHYNKFGDPAASAGQLLQQLHLQYLHN